MSKALQVKAAPAEQPAADMAAAPAEKQVQQQPDMAMKRKELADRLSKAKAQLEETNLQQKRQKLAKRNQELEQAEAARLEKEKMARNQEAQEKERLQKEMERIAKEGGRQRQRSRLRKR
jgi:hypothetical protein